MYMTHELLFSISQELYDDLMAGKRDSVFLKISQAWIARLVDGVTDGEARELAWQENRGRLQCALALGRLRYRYYEDVRLQAPMRTLIYDLDGITIEQAPDGSCDVFKVSLGKLKRIDRNYG